MELNGFEIDEFNVYNLDTKAKLSTCPKCSEHRKKKKQKCFMIDWDRGLGLVSTAVRYYNFTPIKKHQTAFSMLYRP